MCQLSKNQISKIIKSGGLGSWGKKGLTNIVITLAGDN